MRLVIRKRPVTPAARAMTVDPGVVGIGYAVWENLNRDLKKPIASGTVSCGHEKDWMLRMLRMAELLGGTVRLHNVKQIHVELPKVMGGERGEIAAATGDLIKLTISVGCILEAAGCPRTCKPHLVPVNLWKGNVKKELMERRIQAKLGSWLSVHKRSNHEIDAIGIGLYLKGCL